MRTMIAHLNRGTRAIWSPRFRVLVAVAATSALGGCFESGADSTKTREAFKAMINRTIATSEPLVVIQEPFVSEDRKKDREKWRAIEDAHGYAPVPSERPWHRGAGRSLGWMGAVRTTFERRTRLFPH